METLKLASRFFEEIDSNERGAATSRQGIMRICACSGGIVKKTEASLYLYTSPIDFFQSSLGSRISPRVQLLDTGGAQPTVHEEGPLP